MLRKFGKKNRVERTTNGASSDSCSLWEWEKNDGSVSDSTRSECNGVAAQQAGWLADRQGSRLTGWLACSSSTKELREGKPWENKRREATNEYRDGSERGRKAEGRRAADAPCLSPVASLSLSLRSPSGFHSTAGDVRDSPNRYGMKPPSFTCILSLLRDRSRTLHPCLPLYMVNPVYLHLPHSIPAKRISLCTKRHKHRSSRIINKFFNFYSNHEILKNNGTWQDHVLTLSSSFIPDEDLQWNARFNCEKKSVKKGIVAGFFLCKSS